MPETHCNLGLTHGAIMQSVGAFRGSDPWLYFYEMLVPYVHEATAVYLYNILHGFGHGILLLVLMKSQHHTSCIGTGVVESAFITDSRQTLQHRAFGECCMHSVGLM